MNNIKWVIDLSEPEAQRLAQIFGECIAEALGRFKTETGIHVSGSGGGIDLYADARAIVWNHRK